MCDYRREIGVEIPSVSEDESCPPQTGFLYEIPGWNHVWNHVRLRKENPGGIPVGEMSMQKWGATSSLGTRVGNEILWDRRGSEEKRIPFHPHISIYGIMSFSDL